MSMNHSCSSSSCVTCQQPHVGLHHHEGAASLNKMVIELNNLGVLDLQRGDATAAFALLSKAANMITLANINHVHNTHSHTGFEFNWVDCSQTMQGQHPCKHQGSATFLFLRALTISSIQNNYNHMEPFCACGYAWAVWFNLALCCSILGTSFGETGTSFLSMANDLYEKVQYRVDQEIFPTENWQMLAMLIANNRACIFCELRIYEQAKVCLQQLAATLSSCSEMLQIEDRGDFTLNLQIMSNSQTIAAAA